MAKAAYGGLGNFNLDKVMDYTGTDPAPFKDLIESGLYGEGGAQAPQTAGGGLYSPYFDVEKLRESWQNFQPQDKMTPHPSKNPQSEADALRKFIQNPETGAIERNVKAGEYAGPSPIAARNPAHFAANPFSQKSANFADVLRGLGNRKTSLGKEIYGPNTHGVYPNSGGDQNG